MANGIIESLAKSIGFPRVSIYVPMEMKGADQFAENPIKLKNALRQAEEWLMGCGMGRDDVGDLLAEARIRADDDVYFRYQKKGLAVFIEPGHTSFVKLPEDTPYRVEVASHYHIRPLIRMLSDSGWFHVLAVTRDAAKLYHVRRHEIHLAEVDDMPEGWGQVRNQTSFQEGRGFNFRAEARTGSEAVTHGFKGETPEDYQDTLLEHYARDVACAVEAHLGQSHAPLILAAEPRLLGRLREAISYPYVAEKAITRDPTRLSEEELRKLGYDIAKDLMDGDQKAAESRLRAWAEGDGGVKAGRSFEELWRATAEGRLERLFVAQGETIWGRVDAASGIANIIGAPKPGCEDLLNLLALRTIEQGGEVQRLPDDVRPELGPMAGLYRY